MNYLVLLLLFLFSLVPFQGNSQTFFYKLISYGKTGIEHKNVSGGQFITFKAAICMETNNKGYSVGHGHLQRKYNNPDLYFGDSYWGGNTLFNFSSDKLYLTVTAPDNMIYKYKKSPIPEGKITCSLIRNGNISSPPMGESSVKKSQKCGICNGTGKCSTCNGTGLSTNYHSTHVCGACGGTGKCATCSGSGISGYVTGY